MAAPTPQTARDYLVDALRDACAMESRAITLTSSQADVSRRYIARISADAVAER